MQRRFDILTEHVATGQPIETYVNISWANPRDFEFVLEATPGAFEILSSELVGSRFVVKAKRTKTPGDVRLALVYSCETDETSKQDDVDFAMTAPDAALHRFDHSPDCA